MGANENQKFWFNSYFRGMMVYTDPYEALEGKADPRYSTIHGPYDSYNEAFKAKRELIAEQVGDSNSD